MLHFPIPPNYVTQFFINKNHYSVLLSFIYFVFVQLSSSISITISSSFNAVRFHRQSWYRETRLPVVTSVKCARCHRYQEVSVVCSERCKHTTLSQWGKYEIEFDTKRTDRKRDQKRHWMEWNVPHSMKKTALNESRSNSVLSAIFFKLLNWDIRWDFNNCI